MRPPPPSITSALCGRSDAARCGATRFPPVPVDSPAAEQIGCHVLELDTPRDASSVTSSRHSAKESRRLRNGTGMTTTSRRPAAAIVSPADPPGLRSGEGSGRGENTNKLRQFDHQRLTARCLKVPGSGVRFVSAFRVRSRPSQRRRPTAVPIALHGYRQHLNWSIVVIQQRNRFSPSIFQAFPGLRSKVFISLTV